MVLSDFRPEFIRFSSGFCPSFILGIEVVTGGWHPFFGDGYASKPQMAWISWVPGFRVAKRLKSTLGNITHHREAGKLRTKAILV